MCIVSVESETLGLILTKSVNLLTKSVQVYVYKNRDCDRMISQSSNEQEYENGNLQNRPTTYISRKNAVARAVKVEKALKAHGKENPHWLIATTEDGRFFPVFIGQDCFDAVHMGVCVAS